MKMKESHNSDIFWLFLILLFFAFPFAFKIMHFDEATYLLGGAWVNGGYVYLKDFVDNKLPLIYDLTSLVYSITGDNYYLIRVVSVFLYSLSAYIFVLITSNSKTSKFFRFFIFLLIIIISQIYPYVLTELFSIPLFLLFMYFFLKGRTVLAALSAALSVFIRHNLFPAFTLFSILLFLLKDRRAVKFSFVFFIFIFLYFLNFSFLMNDKASYFFKGNKHHLDKTIESFLEIFYKIKLFTLLTISLILIPYLIFPLVVVIFLYKKYLNLGKILEILRKFEFSKIKSLLKARNIKYKENLYFLTFSGFFLIYNSLLLIYLTPRFFVFSYIIIAYLILSSRSYGEEFFKIFEENRFASIFLVIMSIIILSSVFSHYIYLVKEYKCTDFTKLYLLKTFSSCKKWVSSNTILFYKLADRDKPVFYITYYENGFPESFSYQNIKNMVLNGSYCFVSTIDVEKSKNAWGDLDFAKTKLIREEEISSYCGTKKGLFVIYN